VVARHPAHVPRSMVTPAAARRWAYLLDLRPVDLPAAEHVGERSFSLPLTAHLDDDDVEAVVGAVLEVFSG
jgi:dTDP-4-amino-4,6-dideoxygalactose transaminase